MRLQRRQAFIYVVVKKRNVKEEKNSINGYT